MADNNYDLIGHLTVYLYTFLQKFANRFFSGSLSVHGGRVRGGVVNCTN